MQTVKERDMSWGTNIVQVILAMLMFRFLLFFLFLLKKGLLSTHASKVVMLILTEDSQGKPIPRINLIQNRKKKHNEKNKFL